MQHGSEGARRKSIDLGCGRRKVPGALGLDRVQVEGVDIVHDLDVKPYPIPSDSFDEIHARHVIEHVDSIGAFMAEIHRIGAHGARVHVSTPHYTWSGSWRDPTHKWHLATTTFQYFESGHLSGYYTDTARFEIVSIHVTLLSLWRYLGLQWLVNLPNRFPATKKLRRFWEEYLCFVVRAKEMRAVLRVIKA